MLLIKTASFLKSFVLKDEENNLKIITIMKTRRVYIEKNQVQQTGGGCCGPASVQTQPVESSCCGSEPSQIEKQETPSFSCC